MNGITNRPAPQFGIISDYQKNKVENYYQQADTLKKIKDEEADQFAKEQFAESLELLSTVPINPRKYDLMRFQRAIVNLARAEHARTEAWEAIPRHELTRHEKVGVNRLNRKIRERVREGVKELIETKDPGRYQVAKTLEKLNEEPYEMPSYFTAPLSNRLDLSKEEKKALDAAEGKLGRDTLAEGLL